MTDEPHIRHVDFSEAHFLDHSIWACGRYPEKENGGRRRHLYYSWMFKWQPALRAATVCRVGWHKPVPQYRTGLGFERWVCANCAEVLDE